MHARGRSLSYHYNDADLASDRGGLRHLVSFPFKYRRLEAAHFHPPKQLSDYNGELNV